MKLTFFLNIPIFIISLAIGIYAVYVTNNSEKRKITIYPTPDNIDKIQYKDNADNCFQFKQTEVNCPTSPTDISKIRTQ
jgi:hypothetical protein